MHAASRFGAGAFVLLSLVGLACQPKTRTYPNIDGQGGEGGGGLSSSSNGSGVCVAVEDCFNGVDDDCNGSTDCEDPACGAGVAVCAPQLDGVPSGVVVADADACPKGYTADEKVIHRGLVDGGCTGCSCVAKPPTCTGDVWYYATAAECSGDVGLNGGTYAGNYDAQCSPSPISGGQTLGVRTSAWKIQEACSAGGTPTPSPAAWGETRKFCKANEEGKGCSAGKTCVPAVTAAPHCALAAGSASCGAFVKAQSDWYTGLTDTRTCGACGCTVSGGSCGPVTLDVGTDYTCGASAAVAEQTKQCFSGAGIYAPPVQLVGAPKIGTCSGDASTAGSLDGTGQQTLCCQP